MSKIIIIGAGIAGISVAYGLHTKLGKSHSITMVNPVDYFQFTPSNVWVGVGWRKKSDTTLPLEKYLSKFNIRFIPQALQKIDAENNSIYLLDNTKLDYDYLIITTGPKLAFDEIPGAGPLGGFTQSICTVDHAETANTAYQKLLENPGPVVIGAMPGSSCFGPIYEYSLVMSTDLRNKKIRNKIPMTLITSEPYIGHMGLGGVNDSKSLLESELRKNDIKWITNAKTTKVEVDKIFVSELDSNGNTIKEHVVPFKFSMMLPAFKGVDAVSAVDGLCNPRGFVLIDDHQRSKKYPNIYAAGVCVAITPPEQTIVPTGVPKTGYMIETMVSAIIENIAADMDGKPATAIATCGALCLADMGNTGIAFVAIPQIPPRNINWAKGGKWVHWAKVLYEKYFLFKVKHGWSEPVFEKYFLRILGLKRLE
ncbi:MAG: FAD/NAD(P)-binding oxidoreductase [Gammaproteobacteria bacterium]|nr:FAD/NAD(P)-binding oxidoreductase [Gammaproteobacteria bacterium]